MRVRLSGWVAGLDNPPDLAAAAHKARDAGFRRMDAYTPFAVEELTEALPIRRSRLPLIVLLGGLIGGLSGYFLQYYAAGIAFPLDIRGPSVRNLAKFFPVAIWMNIPAGALFGGLRRA